MAKLGLFPQKERLGTIRLDDVTKSFRLFGSFVYLLPRSAFSKLIRVSWDAHCRLLAHVLYSGEKLTNDHCWPLLANVSNPRRRVILVPTCTPIPSTSLSLSSRLYLLFNIAPTQSYTQLGVLIQLEIEDPTRWLTRWLPFLTLTLKIPLLVSPSDSNPDALSLKCCTCQLPRASTT